MMIKILESIRWRLLIRKMAKLIFDIKVKVIKSHWKTDIVNWVIEKTVIELKYIVIGSVSMTFNDAILNIIFFLK